MISFKEYINKIRAWFVSLSVYIKTVLLLVLSILIILYITVYRAPSDFPVSSTIAIEEGLTLEDTAKVLSDANVIQSQFWFKNLVIVFGDDGGVLFGDYFFGERKSVIQVAYIITKGKFGLEPIQITIFEGETVMEIGAKFSSIFSEFDESMFNILAKKEEGYLFPDTYLFLPNVTERTVIRELKKAFDRKVAEVEDEVDQFGKPLSEVIIIASILEREARLLESKRIISGILWKRLSIDMPLQVDAVFPYIFKGNAYDLTNGDLNIDSPYNTYRYKGLPPGPISNPGLESIQAAVTPIETDYLYYLSDRQGKMHYSETFAGHKRNRAMYIR
jgi:UPF0755 protein|tara:strand:+ start:39917 stop:40912 length:996 start_codon:yes stop_codon:yes gene_type:complete